MKALIYVLPFLVGFALAYFCYKAGVRSQRKEVAFLRGWLSEHQKYFAATERAAVQHAPFGDPLSTIILDEATKFRSQSLTKE